MCVHFLDQAKSDLDNSTQIHRGGGMSFFPVKHEKFPLSYIQDAKNFSVVKPLNSG